MASNNNADFEIPKLFDVKGRVALVTGGGSGIGLMCTQALAVNGARVYITGRTASKLDTVARIYGHNIPGEIIPLTADVTSKADIARLVQEIESREQCLCVLINNAGVAGNIQYPTGTTGTDLKKNLFEPEGASYEDWSRTYSTNVTSLYMMTTAFLPLLEKATEHHPGYSGCVINITSISASVATAQNHFSYNASKAAANHVTKLLATEICAKESRVKVRINAIAPGLFPSEMTAEGSGEDQKSSIPRDKCDHLPARRPGADADMGNAVLFMVTNQYLNGQIVPVDGGYLLEYGQVVH